MTPKEKAQELVDKFLLEVRGADRYNYNLESMNVFIAKECAKIAANEAEASEKNVLLKLNMVRKDYISDYWEKVYQEINLI